MTRRLTRRMIKLKLVFKANDELSFWDFIYYRLTSSNLLLVSNSCTPSKYHLDVTLLEGIRIFELVINLSVNLAVSAGFHFNDSSLKCGKQSLLSTTHFSNSLIVKMLLLI